MFYRPEFKNVFECFPGYRLAITLQHSALVRFPFGQIKIPFGPIHHAVQRTPDLEQQLSQSQAPSSLVYHPSMAETYRARVTRLISELGAHGEFNETWEALRALIDKIVVTLSADGEGMEIELCGDLGGLLRLASGTGEHGPDKGNEVTER